MLAEKVFYYSYKFHLFYLKLSFCLLFLTSNLNNFHIIFSAQENKISHHLPPHFSSACKKSILLNHSLADQLRLILIPWHHCNGCWHYYSCCVYSHNEIVHGSLGTMTYEQATLRQVRNLQKIMFFLLFGIFYFPYLRSPRSPRAKRTFQTLCKDKFQLSY